MIRRLIALVPRGRHTAAAAPPDTYGGIDWTETVLVDGANFRGMPCNSSCGGRLTIHELTGRTALCRVCKTTRPTWQTAETEQDHS